MWHSRWWHELAYNLALMSIVLLPQSGCAARDTYASSYSSASSAATKYSDDYHSNNNNTIRMLRFHDFEPRLKQAATRQAGRAARGFHFNANDGDMNVELEFIIPFVRVPVRRSMQLARDAALSVLNLHKGALLNTAVIVVAGAIIAGIVRLVLAPIIFTSLAANNYAGYAGYAGKEEFAEPARSRRGMRSLAEVLESQLDEQQIDVSVCAQRAICQYLQHNAAQLHATTDDSLRPSTAARLIDVLANSSWMNTWLNGTAVFGAMHVARHSRSCSQTYRSCSWPQLHSYWPTILRNFNGHLFA